MSIKDVVEAAKNNNKDAVRQVLKITQDTSKPLDERWDVYLEAEELLPIEDYGDSPVSVFESSGREVSVYDDFHTERGEICNFSHAEEMIDESDEFDDDDVIEFKEAALATGYGGFTYDW